MKIYFLIEGNNKKKTQTLIDIIKKVEEYAGYSVIEKDSQNLYFKHKKDNIESDFVCLLHEDITLHEYFMLLYRDYILNEPNTLYLPLILLNKDKIRGVLNNCLWNSNLAVQVGQLDPELSLKQMDTTLYGSLIPFNSFFDKDFYNEEIKYYQHFYFLNKFTDNEDNLVVGIPKILGSLGVDLSFENILEEEKIQNFKLAKKIKKQELHIV